MPAQSRGKVHKSARAAAAPTKVVKPRKRTDQTPSSRRHHFESFSSRISKLRIDPIRRARRAIGAEGSHDLDKDTSYFRTALDEWKDLNMSEHFTAFAKVVYPLTDSMAMLLHYEDRIMDLLMEYITKGTVLSLEPLLALLSHFAHDLDVRFEKHFERAVATVTQVSAKDADVDVVEWSFTCLAWLFKYLSRLLVPDLRPLYNLMAPYMGKVRQKAFIIRFAAEAMSFLVRKAGTSYKKDSEPLDLIVKHILDDYSESTPTGPQDLYAQGVMTLFTESIKGIQRSLHSGGNAVLQALTKYCFAAEHDATRKGKLLHVSKGSLISVLHHTDVETFKPVLDAILEMTDFANNEEACQNLDSASMLFFTAVGTRKGSRIGEWPLVISRVASLFRSVDKADTTVAPASMAAALNTLAVVLHYAPLDAILPEIAVLDTISRGKWRALFLPFCNLFAELDAERFQGLVLSHFQRFIAANWQDNQESLCALLPALSRQGLFAKSPLQCPLAWQKSILKHLEHAKTSSEEEADKLFPLCNGELAVLQASQGDTASRKAISAQLLDMIKDATHSNRSGLTRWESFVLGPGLHYVSNVSVEALKEPSLLEAICTSSPRAKGLLPYWTAIAQVLKEVDTFDISAPWVADFISDVMDCLSAPSHDIRLVGLHIMRNVYSKTHEEVPELITIALSIEDTPPTVQTARFISSQIRRFALGYSGALSDAILAKAIPTYCFGLLHMQLSQAWDDSISSMKEMAEHQQAEEVIFELVSKWLQGASDDDDSPRYPPKNEEAASRHVSSDFECSNVNQIEKAIKDASAPFMNPQDSLEREFTEAQTRTLSSPLTNRSQALRALNGMPQLAEKRSRIIVPILLEWAGSETDVVDHGEDDEVEEERWNRKDQKAMLQIFSQFQNPKVLFKSAEARQALLNLLSNGDAEIQQSALKAILAWKTPEVTRYQEHLLNLLDDARFREEISVFIRLDEDEGDAIRIEDCSELMPVLLRLLYGKAVARAGSASGKRGQQTRRKAIFVALSRFPDSILQQFLDIAIGSLSKLELIKDGSVNALALEDFSFAQRKQVGLLNMLDDMIQTLGDRLTGFARRIADATLLCLLKTSKSTAVDEVGESDQTSLDRVIRQAGFHCLIQLFSTCTNVQWRDYAAVIMKELVQPRLDKLAVETAQSVSGILRLFSTWSASPATCTFLTDFYPDALKSVADCLSTPSAKNEVKMFVVEKILGCLLDNVQPLSKDRSAMNLDLTQEQEKIRSNVLEPYASLFVVKLGGILRQTPPKELLDASVLCVSRLAPLVTGVSNIRDVIDVSIFLLGQPPRIVHHSTKRDLLKTLSYLVPGADLEGDEQRFNQVYSTLCPLFSFFKDRESRSLLSGVLTQLGSYDKDLEEPASLCEDLNSFSTSRLDEPDFERRSQAFNAINETGYKTLSARQWQPLMYNMLYYIKDNEELAIRANASYSLRRFVEAASSQGNFKDPNFQELVSSGLWPGLQNGVRDDSELVRVEFLNVTAHLIKYFPSWDAVNDMHSLLVENDEEASFFANILHIQQHRRLRALRRLADEAKDGVISSVNVSNFFIPLLEHFIFDPAGDESAHNLAAETINSVGALSRCLEWTQYRGTLRRFVGYVKSKPELQKTVLRIVGSVIDALDQAAQAVRNNTNKTSTDDGDDRMIPDGSTAMVKLAQTLPTEERLAAEINKQFLPPLTEFLHLKDESTVSLRVPVAVSVIKLIRTLPAQEHPLRLPSVLMDICHILRSKATEARDMTRKTLAEIMAILGPPYFGYILKELRSALQRGYQLHVMSFTVHSILVENSALLHAGDLDYCLSDMVAIIMDDIFGVAGQEKDAEEYISKMKEVKSSKSYDSMELVAKITTLPHLGELIQPIQILLSEKLNLKTVKKIDELLRRIGLGTTLNGAVKDRDVLVFCYEIIQQVHANSVTSKKRPAMDDYKIRKYLIQMKGASKNSNKGATSSYMFKLTRFALDLVRSVLQRHEDLKTPANVVGFLPIVGDSLIGGQEEVQMAATRLLTSIIKVPSPKIAENAPVYASEAVKLLRAASSTTTELAQAALKLVSAILRERPNVRIKENDIAYVLKRVKPDLEQPDRQGVIFNFLKAVLTRKVVIVEVYEVMDTVAAIMVTNQTRTARDLARGIYFQFMMDYPQATNRLSKQIAFLIKNLEYDYVEGRQSVLELLHLLLSKTNGDLAQDLCGMLFVPLVMMMVNDDSPECREMAGALISKILERADDEKTKNFVGLLRTWLEQDEQPLLRRVALQCWTMYIGSGKASTKEISFLFKQLVQLLQPDDQQSGEEWEILYYSLQAFAKLSEVAPSTALSAASKKSWTNIFRCLVYPHAWVKLSAAKLVGLLFADVGSASSKTEAGLKALTLRSSGGLELTEDELHQLCSASLRIMRFTNVTEQLVSQTVRNLIFLGRCYSANGAIWTDAASKQADAMHAAASSDGGAPEASDDDDDDENGDEDQANGESGSAKSANKTALSHLFSRLSALVRRDAGAITHPIVSAKTGALQVIAALTNALPTDTLLPSLQTILLPLYILTDPSIPAPGIYSSDPSLGERYQALVGLAQEILNLLQKKMGSGVYVNAMGKVQAVVRGKREDRRRKRRIEAVAEPEKWAQDKRRKHDATRLKRKEKGAEARGKRRGW